MSLFILINVFYHNQRYYLAWARSPEIKLAFSDDVVLIRKQVATYIAEAENTVHIGLDIDDERKQRIRSWLEVSIDDDQAVTSVIHPSTNFDELELLVVGPNLSEDKPNIDLSGFELDESIDTTSKLKPHTYNFYIPKTE